MAGTKPDSFLFYAHFQFAQKKVTEDWQKIKLLEKNIFFHSIHFYIAWSSSLHSSFDNHMLQEILGGIL